MDFKKAKPVIRFGRRCVFAIAIPKCF